MNMLFQQTHQHLEHVKRLKTMSEPEEHVTSSKHLNTFEHKMQTFISHPDVNPNVEFDQAVQLKMGEYRCIFPNSDDDQHDEHDEHVANVAGTFSGTCVETDHDAIVQFTEPRASKAN